MKTKELEKRIDVLEHMLIVVIALSVMLSFILSLGIGGLFFVEDSEIPEITNATINEIFERYGEKKCLEILNPDENCSWTYEAESSSGKWINPTSLLTINCSGNIKEIRNNNFYVINGKFCIHYIETIIREKKTIISNL